MKTTIETKTAGEIKINSVYLGDKLWKIDNSFSHLKNYNNHRVTVTNNGKKYSFEYWASIAETKIKDEQGNVFAFYCSLSDGISAMDSFEDFCREFGYDTDSRNAERIYKSCVKTLNKLERVFDCDLYDLINEIQERWNC